jgi:hypothetical protein
MWVEKIGVCAQNLLTIVVSIVNIVGRGGTTFNENPMICPKFLRISKSQ